MIRRYRSELVVDRYIGRQCTGTDDIAAWRIVVTPVSRHALLVCRGKYRD
jgi:hypothetical protein